MTTKQELLQKGHPEEAIDNFINIYSEETLEHFETAYKGYFAKKTDFAKKILCHSLDLSIIPESIRKHFDFEAYAEELFGYEYTFVMVGVYGQGYVFGKF